MLGAAHAGPGEALVLVAQLGDEVRSAGVRVRPDRLGLAPGAVYRPMARGAVERPCGDRIDLELAPGEPLWVHVREE
jgi:hypothetical protein